VAKTWVLDTETKGTGAHVVPLERAGGRHGPERALDTVTLRRPQRPASRPEPAGSPAFKVVDVMSAEVIAEGVDARAAVEALEPMRSVHDARVYVWAQDAGRWRLLTFAEQRSLWRMRARARAARPARQSA
jgi:hypothetical protein